MDDQNQGVPGAGQQAPQPSGQGGQVPGPVGGSTGGMPQQ